MKFIFVLLACFIFPSAAQSAVKSLTHKSHVEKNSPFSGDMRLRFQQSYGNELVSGYFIRIRGGTERFIHNTLGWDFGLASGGWIETSRDQRLGGFDAKPLWFDKASIIFKPVRNLRLQLGKMDNPYYDPQRYNLIWDEDLKPEGISAGYILPFFNQYEAALNASVFLRDAAFKGVDGLLQANEKLVNQNSLDQFLAAGSALFLMDYKNYDFRAGLAFYGVQTEGGKMKRTDGRTGNSAVSSDTAKYKYNYSILDIFLQMHLKSLWKPLSMSVQLVQNFAVQDSSMGVIAGGMLGNDKKVRSWVASYHFLKLERDATLAQYTDSDIGGQGANYSGHQVTAGWRFSPSTKVEMKYIFRKDDLEKASLNHILFGSVSINI